MEERKKLVMTKKKQKKRWGVMEMGRDEIRRRGFESIEKERKRRRRRRRGKEGESEREQERARLFERRGQ